MYLGIDVGGTKTLVATLDNDGVIDEEKKFPTPHNYSKFLKELAKVVDELSTKDFQAVGVAIPGEINRKSGIGLRFGNLPWDDVPIAKDIEKIINSPLVLENDAKLGGLSEAMLRKDISRILFITVSTGIGYSLIVDRVIDKNIADLGGKTLLIEHRGSFVPWESFASGRVIVETFGKEAHDIDDAQTWQKIALNLSRGVIELIAVTEPDLIVFGGSVGVYLDRFKKYLTADLKHLETPLLRIPPIEAAKRPENAVIYGCYDYIKQVFGN